MLCEVGQISCFLAPVKMSRPVMLALAWPCLPVFEVVISITYHDDDSENAIDVRYRYLAAATHCISRQALTARTLHGLSLSITIMPFCSTRTKNHPCHQRTTGGSRNK